MHLKCMTHIDACPNIIVEAMSALEMNQPLLADALGVDQGTVSRWKNGKSKPSRPVLKLIERLLADRRSADRSAEAAE